jgi:hypothetical protein
MTSVGSGVSAPWVINVESEEYVTVGVLPVSVVVGVLVGVSVVVPVSVVVGVLVAVSVVVPVSPVDVVEGVSAAWWWWCVCVAQSRFGVGVSVDQSAIGVGDGVDQSAIGVGDHPKPVDGVGTLASSLNHHEP